jgi:hypothetical protein
VPQPPFPQDRRHRARPVLVRQSPRVSRPPRGSNSGPRRVRPGAGTRRGTTGTIDFASTGQRSQVDPAVRIGSCPLTRRGPLRLNSKSGPEGGSAGSLASPSIPPGGAMAIIFGWGGGRLRDRGAAAPVNCPRCGNSTFYRYASSTKWFRLYFIPLIPYSSSISCFAPFALMGSSLIGRAASMHKEWSS